MSAVLLNCNCQKRISFKLIGGHLQLIWSEFFDIFIVITFWFIMSFFSPHITASRSRDGWRIAISIYDIFCRFFSVCSHTIFHSCFQTYFWSRILSKHPFFLTREGKTFCSESLFFRNWPEKSPQSPEPFSSKTLNQYPPLKQFGFSKAAYLVEEKKPQTPTQHWRCCSQPYPEVL